MEIKRIEHLSKDECREYLQNNPDGELVKEVQGRLNAILAAEEKARQRKEAERKASVTLKNKWIDVNQFLEKRKYKNLNGVRTILLILFSICLIAILTTLYYTNSTHYIHSESWSEQCSKTYGLENVLLNLRFLKMPWYWYDDETVFPTWDNYREGDTFFAFLLIGGFLLVMFLITTLNHSSLIGKIYNIGDGTKTDKFRPVQNKQGRCGLCQLGRTRLKRLLPFQYDLICPAKENSFICCKESKYGVYNAATKKMVIPVEYDDIYLMGESIIKLVKNGEIHIFSYKGYRIIE